MDFWEAMRHPSEFCHQSSGLNGLLLSQSCNSWGCLKRAGAERSWEELTERPTDT